MSSYERTGWRDVDLMKRHLLWGSNLPAVNIDHLVVEFDFGKPVAIIDYKHEYTDNTDHYSNEYSILALISLAEERYCPIPLFFVRYGSQFNWWQVHPITDRAREHLNAFKDKNQRCGTPRNLKGYFPDRWCMTEYGFISYLCSMRHVKMSSDLRFNGDGWLVTVNGSPVTQMPANPPRLFTKQM